MRGGIERVGVAHGELLAVDVPPGPTWLDIVAWCWREGVAFLPLHHRLTDPEKRAIVDLARPAAILTAEGESTWFADPAPVEERVGIVVATSGTAGSPRLVELSRDAVAAAMAGSNEAIGAGGVGRATDPPAPWVCCLSPAHVGGLLVLLRGVLGGAPVLVQDRFDVDRFATGSPDGARASLVPAMLRRLVDAGVDLSRLGELLVGGDAVEPGLAEAARGLGGIVVSTYGLTETCGGVVYDGRPFSGTQLRVQDPDALIEVRGPTVMEHYRGDPEATGAAFSVDGWLSTGDVGSLDEGVLRVEGRKEDLIRTGAEKVWPEEVERVLRTEPRVAEVAVAGRPDPEWGERVVAFVVPRSPDDPPTLSELREGAADRIARFKVPRELVLVDALPRTASGKIRRIALRGRR